MLHGRKISCSTNVQSLGITYKSSKFDKGNHLSRVDCTVGLTISSILVLYFDKDNYYYFVDQSYSSLLHTTAQ